MKTYAILLVLAAMLCGTEAMVAPVGATTINFNSETAGVYGGNVTGVFRTSPILSGVGWTTQSSVTENPTPAVFAHMEGPTNLQVNLSTFIPFLAHAAGEFTFKGVDIYHDNTASMQVLIQGLEGPDTNLLRYSLNLDIAPGTGWFHYDLSLPFSVRALGALNFNVQHVTGTPGVTVGFDNLRVCQGSLLACSYDDPLLFRSTVPPVVTAGAVPEPSVWIYMMLAGGVVLVLRKVFREETTGSGSGDGRRED